MTDTKKDTKSVFELKKDVTVPIFGTSEVYSDRNLTDEAALKILSRNANAIALFKKFPKNWEELVEGYKAGETEVKSLDEVAKLTVAQIRALFPKAKGRSKDDLLKSISELYPELSGEGGDTDPNAGDDENQNPDGEGGDTDPNAGE